MDPHYMDKLEKNTFKLCTPKKKNGETKGGVLSLLNLVSLLSVEKSQVGGRDQFSILYSETIISHLDFCGIVKFGPLEVEMILKLQFA